MIRSTSNHTCALMDLGGFYYFDDTKHVNQLFCKIVKIIKMEPKLYREAAWLNKWFLKLRFLYFILRLLSITSITNNQKGRRRRRRKWFDSVFGSKLYFRDYSKYFKYTLLKMIQSIRQLVATVSIAWNFTILTRFWSKFTILQKKKGLQPWFKESSFFINILQNLINYLVKFGRWIILRTVAFFFFKVHYMDLFLFFLFIYQIQAEEVGSKSEWNRGFPRNQKNVNVNEGKRSAGEGFKVWSYVRFQRICLV